MMVAPEDNSDNLPSNDAAGDLFADDGSDEIRGTGGSFGISRMSRPFPLQKTPVTEKAPEEEERKVDDSYSQLLWLM